MAFCKEKFDDPNEDIVSCQVLVMTACGREYAIEKPEGFCRATGTQDANCCLSLDV